MHVIEQTLCQPPLLQQQYLAITQDYLMHRIEDGLECSHPSSSRLVPQKASRGRSDPLTCRIGPAPTCQVAARVAESCTDSLRVDTMVTRDLRPAQHNAENFRGISAFPKIQVHQLQILHQKDVTWAFPKPIAPGPQVQAVTMQTNR